MTAPVDLAGAADLHVHFGPDPHRERALDAVDAAREARDAGHAALVLKSHSEPTAGLAHAVQRAVGDELRVFGGLCCDREVGGLNPDAVETALRLGAKIIWLPTLSSQQDVDNGVAAQLGLPPVGLTVIDPATDALWPEAEEVLALIVEHGAVLATGHVSAAEHVAVTRAVAGRTPVLITHAREELAGPNLTVDECIELADLGAVVELCALTCIGRLATRAPAEMADTARRVGPSRCTLATDFGQAGNPHPAAGLQQFADALATEGLAEQDIRTMACDNPRALLGL